MWDRKKPEPPPRQGNRPTSATGSATAVATAPHPAQTPAQPVHRAPEPQQPPAAPPPAPASKGPGTAIGSAVTIVGDVYSEEDLFVDGEVQGRLDIKDCRLTVGPNGKAKSNIRAREVIIQGQVQGDVDATQKITIRKNGSLVGNIKTTGIVIDDDAYFKGSIDIVRKDAGSA